FTKLDRNSVRRLINRDDVQLLRQPTQPGISKKPVDRCRNAPVTVLRLSPNGSQCRFVTCRRNSFVRPQPLSHIGDVILGNGNIDAKVERYTGLILNLFTLKLSDSPLEHLRVKIEAQRLHVAGLLPPEQVARAT